MLEIPSAPLTVASVPLLCNQATRLSIIGDTAATALLLRVSISFTTVGSPAVVSAAFGQPPHAIGITVAVRIPPNQLPPAVICPTLVSLIQGFGSLSGAAIVIADVVGMDDGYVNVSIVCTGSGAPSTVSVGSATRTHA